MPPCFALCDRETAVVESFRGERVVDDVSEVAAFEDMFRRFEEAAVFGSEVRELLLQVMADFRDLDTLATR